MYRLTILLAMAALVTADQGTSSKLKEVFKWKQLDFQFPNENVRTSLISSKKYIPANNNILGLEVWRDKIFLTVPRWLSGVASTLNYISLGSRTKSPQLIPYPDYASNDIHNGIIDHKLISATRIFVDSCNRLWVPDNGIDGVSTRELTKLSSHKLFVFDLLTNTLIRRITIGDAVKAQSSMFYEVAVDITTGCDKAFAYISDTVGYGLVVYNWESDTLNRVTNSYLFFEPHASVFNSVQFSDGVMGLALSPVRDGYRTLYFHALASYSEYNVSTRILRDPQLASDYTNFKLMGSRGERGQSTTQRLDEKTGVVVYTQVLQNGIGCWNSKLYPGEYSTATTGIAAVDRDRITFPSALALDTQRTVWVLSDNLLSFSASALNPKEYNYRIFNASIDSLIKDTVCNPPSVGAQSGPIWS